VLSAEPSIGVLPNQLGDGPLLLSIKDAAEQLGIGRSPLYELMNRGEIDHVRIGRRKLISRDALRSFIAANTRSGYEP